MKTTIAGVLFVVGGLSGARVLLGTESGGLLALVGFVLIIVGIARQAYAAPVGDEDARPVVADERTRDAAMLAAYQRGLAETAAKSEPGAEQTPKTTAVS